MSSLVRGRSWGLRALAAAAFLFVAACGGSQTTREPGEDADAQVLVERSPADEVAARKREEARQRCAVVRRVHRRYVQEHRKGISGQTFL